MWNSNIAISSNLKFLYDSNIFLEYTLVIFEKNIQCNSFRGRPRKKRYNNNIVIIIIILNRGGYNYNNNNITLITDSRQKSSKTCNAFWLRSEHRLRPSDRPMLIRFSVGPLLHSHINAYLSVHRGFQPL